jgi:hypothetical protein
MACTPRLLAVVLLTAVLGLEEVQLVRAQWLPPLAPLPPLPPLQGMQPMAPLPQMAPIGGGSAAYGMAASSQQPMSGGNAPAGCQLLQQSSGGGSCVNGACCSVSQRVERCTGSHLSATAVIDGATAVCCISLLRQHSQSQELFCTAPSAGRAYSRMPASAVVTLSPACVPGRPGSLSCTVTFPGGPPQGFVVPSSSSSSAPQMLVPGARGVPPGFSPCLAGSRFSRMVQAVSTRSPVLTLAVVCE